MRRTLAALMITASLLTATRADATTLVDEAGSPVGGMAQQIVDRSRLDFGDRTITFIAEGCPPPNAEPACAQGPNVRGPRPYVWLAPWWMATDSGSQTLYHELCHTIDYELLDDTERAGLMMANGDVRAWRAGAPNSPHERFAEACALVARHGDRRHCSTRRPKRGWPGSCRPASTGQGQGWSAWPLSGGYGVRFDKPGYERMRQRLLAALR